jgi:RNA-directed DNA polymerase
VVLCHDEVQVPEVRARLEDWLKPRGLRFNEEKTKVVHLAEGFDFLGFTVRRTGGKLIIRPSTEACKRLRARLRTEVKTLTSILHGGPPTEPVDRFTFGD